MFTGDNIISLISILMTAFTSICVAWLGVRHSRKEKQEESYRELQAENDRMQKEKQEEEKETYIERLHSIETSVSDLSEDISDMSHALDMEDIHKQLLNLHELNKINFEYIQSLSNVVVTIGETIDVIALNPDDKEKLQEEIHTHKSKEEKINAKLYSIIL